jgi:hypothetical protein
MPRSSIWETPWVSHCITSCSQIIKMGKTQHFSLPWGLEIWWHLKVMSGLAKVGVLVTLQLLVVVERGG